MIDRSLTSDLRPLISRRYFLQPAKRATDLLHFALRPLLFAPSSTTPRSPAQLPRSATPPRPPAYATTKSPTPLQPQLQPNPRNTMTPPPPAEDRTQSTTPSPPERTAAKARENTAAIFPSQTETAP